MRYIPKGTKHEWFNRVMAIEDIDMRHRIAMIIWWDCSVDGDVFWRAWYDTFKQHFKADDRIDLKRMEKVLEKVGYRSGKRRIPKYRREGKLDYV